MKSMPSRNLRHRKQLGPSHKALFLSVLVSFAVAAAFASAEPFVAGTTPSRRPASAPKVRAVVRDDDFFESALHGVNKPYPPSLMFLKDQGNWYSPFTHPGMRGPYDIRHWHTAPAHPVAEGAERVKQ